MKKIGRNQPCPCGSGKKYKKCHGASNVVNRSPVHDNAELEQLHTGLIEFTIKNYEDKLAQTVQKYIQPSMLEDKELLNSYMTGLSAWAIMNEPIENDQTIFEIYAEKQNSKINKEDVKNTFASWNKVIPSMYEIISITEEKLILKDLRTEERFILSGKKGKNLNAGMIVIGILLPYADQHAFFLSVIALSGVEAEVIQLLETLTEEELINSYPDVLAKTLQVEPVSMDLEWKNPLHEQVADLFTEHAIEKGINENNVSVGVALWKLFTEKENPAFKKPEAYAAALEYMMQHVVLKELQQSQKELAEEYGTSPGTLSKNFRKMNEVLDEELKKVTAEMAE